MGIRPGWKGHGARNAQRPISFHYDALGRETGRVIGATAISQSWNEAGRLTAQALWHIAEGQHRLSALHVAHLPLRRRRRAGRHRRSTVRPAALRARHRPPGHRRARLDLERALRLQRARRPGIRGAHSLARLAGERRGSARLRICRRPYPPGRAHDVRVRRARTSYQGPTPNAIRPGARMDLPVGPRRPAHPAYRTRRRDLELRLRSARSADH